MAKRIAALDLSDTLSSELLPLFEILAPINEQIAAADRRLTALVAADPAMTLLATAPSVGPITASPIVATVDDVRRFTSAHQFEAFLGLVPGEYSSGEKRRIGRITKAGNVRVRYLLVEAGLATAAHEGRRNGGSAGVGVGDRGGGQIARAARRLAGTLYAMWRDGVAYDPHFARPRVASRQLRRQRHHVESS